MQNPPIEHRGGAGPGPGMRGQPMRNGSRPPPPPPPAVRPPGPPPGQQFPGGPMPHRPQMTSTKYVDLSPRQQLDDDACKKLLTTYAAISIRRAVPRDPKKDKLTWAKTEQTLEPLPQDMMAKQVKQLNEGPSVTEKKQKLKHFQQSQVNNVLDNLKNGELNGEFEWSLAQIDQKFDPVMEKGKKKKETQVITVYAKRTLRAEFSPFQVYSMQERMKQERAMAPRPSPGPPPGQVPVPVRVDQPQIVNLGNRRGRRHHDDSSSFTDSNSDSGTDYSSSSENTSYSSRSGRRSKSYHHHGRRGRSHSRRRQYHRDSYIADGPRSPALHVEHHVGHLPLAPEVPRTLVPTEEVTAAYQRGRIDADAERFGLEYPRGRVPIIHPGPLERVPMDRFSEDRYADELQLAQEERMRQRRLADISQRVYDRARIVQPNPFIPRYTRSDGSWSP